MSESHPAELLDLGVARITGSEALSTEPGAERTLRYRGAKMRVQMRSELRLECAAPAVIVPAIVAFLREHSDQIALIELEDVRDPAYAAVPL